MDFWHEAFKSTLGGNKNGDRRSDIVAVILPEITSWEIILENTLSIRVFEWLVIVDGFKTYGIKKVEGRKSKIYLQVDSLCNLVS